MTSEEINRRDLLPKSSSLDVFLLGMVELGDSLQLLERLRIEVATRTDLHGSILVCEHPPAITIGREGSFADVLVDREELISRRMEVRWTNRGGATLIHTPGQLAAYIAVPLDRLKVGLHEFRTRLENGLIALASDFQITAERSAKTPGVAGRCGQFGFIGMAVRDWTTCGGIYLNVSMPPEALEIVRWGEDDTRVTSLSALRTRAIAISTARESLVRNLAAAIGYDSYHLYTGHPLLHRTSRKVYVYS